MHSSAGRDHSELAVSTHSNDVTLTDCPWPSQPCRHLPDHLFYLLLLHLDCLHVSFVARVTSLQPNLFVSRAYLAILLSLSLSLSLSSHFIESQSSFISIKRVVFCRLSKFVIFCFSFGSLLRLEQSLCSVLSSLLLFFLYKIEI
jgi:hypothetical protein